VLTTNLIDVSISDEGSEVVDLTYVKLYCQIDGSNHDALLMTLIKSARQDVEKYADISIVTKTIRAEWTSVSEYAILPKPRINDIDSVFDSQENELFLDSAYQIRGQDKKRIIGDFSNGLVVTYGAGYGTDVPEDLKMSITKKVLMDFEARTGLSVSNSQSLLLPNSWEKTAIAYRPTWMIL